MNFLNMLQEVVHTEEKKKEHSKPCVKCGHDMSSNEAWGINGRVRTGYTCYECGTSLWNEA